MQKRNRLRGDLAPVVKNVTETTTVVWSSPETVMEEKFVDSHVPRRNSKTSLVIQLGQPHSVGSVPEGLQQPSSLDDGLNAAPGNVHHSRETNSSNFEQNHKPKLALPPSHDLTWNAINAELNEALPKVFPQSRIDSCPTSQLASEFDSWLHAFLKDRCGLAPVKQRLPTHSNVA